MSLSKRTANEDINNKLFIILILHSNISLARKNNHLEELNNNLKRIDFKQIKIKWIAKAFFLSTGFLTTLLYTKMIIKL